MMRNVLPSIFEEVSGDPCNSLVERGLDEGRRAVGYTCSYIPEPLISVDGLMPLRLRAAGVAGTPMADTYLSSVVCPYVRSLLELALEGRYDFLDGWLFAASCDHVRRLHDNLEYLSAPAFNHILDVPHKTGDAALDWYQQDLARLVESLSVHFGVDAGPAALETAIERHNAHLGRLRAVAELRKGDPPLSGTAFHKLLVACGMAPKDLLAEPLEELAETLAGAEPIRDHRARLLVVGSQLDEPAYLATIEAMGGLVVADRFCVGSLPGMEPIPNGGEPLRRLAEYSLRQTRCPRMMEEFEQRVTELLTHVREYRADGVVLETMKFCDLWGVESSALLDALRDAGVPVLRLEREYAFSGEGQIRTRVQAFLESMGK